MRSLTSQLATRQLTDAPTGYRVEGNGPAVVLLHSSMGSKSQWRSLIECMRGAYRLIAIDLHGYGDAAMPENRDRHTLDAEVQLVQSVLERTLGPQERFHLVGHSFGGGVALRLAHACPERALSLCLYEPTAFHLLKSDDPALHEVEHVARIARAGVQNGDALAATGRFIDFWSGPGAFAALPPARQSLFASMLPKVPLDFQALFHEPLNAADYGRLAVPVCLMAGRDSPECARAIVAILSAVLAQGETHEIDDAGHMGPLTHPALVNPIIEGFIGGVEARREAFACSRTWPYLV